ncbi:hypothetical protein IJV57_05410 [Candidatus Saccharibacteria bacterium]|nr:hypothetical protein [Candidatus Saccharibacteria bacterium]
MLYFGRWCRPTLIAWTSELEKYRDVFESAAQECVESLPGFNFRLLPCGEDFKDFKDTDSYIRNYIRMDQDRGWVIRSDFVTDDLTWEIMDLELRNITIVFTRQPISGENDRRYDDYDTRAAIVSLEPCRDDEEIRKAVPVMLKHALGHILLGYDEEPHCSSPYCAMHAMTQREFILSFPPYTAKESCFCEKCTQKMREGRIWVNEPSFISEYN